MKVFLAFIFSAFVSTSALAAGSSTGLVTGLLANDPGRVMFSAGVHINKPTCSIVGDQWAIDATTQGGRQMVNILTLAYALGKTVAVNGTGGCAAWGDRESPLYLYIID